MKKYITAVTGGLALIALAACTDNPAAPSVDRVVAGSQQELQTLLIGVVGTDRSAVGGSYFTYGSYMARDAMHPDGNEPRFTSEFFNKQPDPSDFIGGAQWTNYYVALRAIHSLLVDQSLTALPTDQQAAARGFLRTTAAREYLNLLDYRNDNGIVIQGDDPSVQDPLVGKATALAYVVALLDSANADLAAAGDISVPFDLPSGYTGHGDYSKVSNLILYNRALVGKAEVGLALMDSDNPDLTAAAAAVTALNTALAGASATKDYLNQGPYYEYNPGSPDFNSNPLVDDKLMLTVNFVNSIDAADARKSKIVPDAAQSAQGFTSAAARLAITDPQNTQNLTAELPIMRNAELYLLRAQAEIALGQLPAATADINVVHTVEGGLPAYATFATADAAIQALLYEYRYSFVLQGPQHLVALRTYGLLNDAYISQPGIPTAGVGTDVLLQKLPIPRGESDARNGNITPVGP
jgi:hypothetical protein